MSILDSKIPEGPLETKWSGYTSSTGNQRTNAALKLSSLGLDFGASAAASLGEMGC